MRRDRGLAGIEHQIHQSAPELLDGRSAKDLEHIRHEIAHTLRSQSELVETASSLLQELQLGLSGAILAIADRGGEQRRTFSAFLPRENRVRPDARASIFFDGEVTSQQPYFGKWLEVSREFPEETSRIEPDGSYVWGAATRLRWKLDVGWPTSNAEYVMYDREGMNTRFLNSGAANVPVLPWRDEVIPPSIQRLRDLVR